MLYNDNNMMGAIEKTCALFTHNNQHSHKMSAYAASSPAAAIAAAINDGKDDGQEQVSDVVNNTTDNDNDDVSNNDVSNDKDGEMEADTFFGDAQEIMNLTTLKIGAAAMEDHWFCSFFDTRKEIIKMVWDMLGGGGCLCPKKSKPKHLLWPLYFLKVYPRKAPRCSTLSGSKGAIDPKTMQKWVWLFIECIA